jgi:hypothetical protein
MLSGHQKVNIYSSISTTIQKSCEVSNKLVKAEEHDTTYKAKRIEKGERGVSYKKIKGSWKGL